MRQPLCQARGDARAELGDEGALLADIRDDALAGIRRSRGPHVDDFIEQGMIVLVPDRADDRGGCFGYCPHHSFVAETEQDLMQSLSNPAG